MSRIEGAKKLSEDTYESWYPLYTAKGVVTDKQFGEAIDALKDCKHTKPAVLFVPDDIVKTATRIEKAKNREGKIPPTNSAKKTNLTRGTRK